MVDSKQELIEMLSLRDFLSERRRYLLSLQDRAILMPAQRKELKSIENALKPCRCGIKPEEVGQYLHSTEAGTKLEIRLSAGVILSEADHIQIEAMKEFPEINGNGGLARRSAYLRALSEVGLASDDELDELGELEESVKVVNL